MVSTRSIQVRMTKDQHERIRNNSKVKGFNSLSAYMRYVALDQDFIIQQKICDVYDHIFGKELPSKFKKNAALKSSH
jgi:hypothetical protein